MATEAPLKPTLPQTDVPLTLDVKLGDSTKTIKMTFAKLNRLCQIIGSLHNVDTIIMDPVISQAVLAEVLANKKEPVDLDEIDISMDTSAQIIGWAGSHVLDFFIKLGDNFNKMSQPVMEAAKAVAERVAKENPPTS